MLWSRRKYVRYARLVKAIRLYSSYKSGYFVEQATTNMLGDYFLTYIVLYFSCRLTLVYTDIIALKIAYAHPKEIKYRNQLVA